MTKTDWAERIYRGRKKAYEEGLERGIELGIDQGVILEQERIIKLLEARSDCGVEHAYNGTCFCEEIALIKGEQKWD
jgi:hypothetical protein